MPAIHNAQWRFPGGIQLQGHKHESTRQPAQDLPRPKTLILPLEKSRGEPARPVVAVGEPVRKGQVIARPVDEPGVPVHASLAGRITAIEPLHGGNPLLDYPVACIRIDTCEDTPDRDAENATPDWQALDPETLCQRIREAGIAGLGGAAFPAHIKLAGRPGHPIETLIINGAECEPWITCDQILMRDHAAEVIAGARILAHAAGAQQILLAVEDHQQAVFTALQQQLEAQDTESQAGCPLTLVRVPTIYPEGGEKQLVQILTGQEVPSGGLPIDIGLLCHNAGTAAAVYDAVCLGRPLLSRIVTVTGDCIVNPGNFRVPLGTPVSELVAAAGGYTPTVQRLIMGGPMMGVALASDDVPVVKATDCILALGGEQLAHADEAMPCIRCGECAEACPVNLLPQQLYWHARGHDSEQLHHHGLFDCIECGCCAVVCPSHIPLVQYYREAKTELWLEDYEQQLAGKARSRYEFRLQRLADEQQAHEAELEARKPLAGNTPDREMARETIRAARERARARRRRTGNHHQGQD